MEYLEHICRKIREIINAFKRFLGILNVTESHGSLRLERRMVLKCICKVVMSDLDYLQLAPNGILVGVSMSCPFVSI